MTKALEAALDAPRHDWPTGLCRRLWEFLAEVAEQRRRSPAHYGRWYNLVGYCLRPGFGDPLDKFRVEQLWKMLHAPPRGDAGSSGGAAAGGRRRLLDHVAARGRRAERAAATGPLSTACGPICCRARARATVKPQANELAEMWRAAASLERLDVKHKEALGDALLKPLRRSPVPTYGFWALTRLGARVLLYGPLNAVVHPQVVQRWLDAILSFQPGNQSERLGWAFCLAQLARRSGQRALDIDDSHRQSVLTVLRGLDVPAHWPQMVEEVTRAGTRGAEPDVRRIAADRPAIVAAGRVAACGLAIALSRKRAGESNSLRRRNGLVQRNGRCRRHRRRLDAGLGGHGRRRDHGSRRGLLIDLRFLAPISGDGSSAWRADRPICPTARTDHQQHCSTDEQSRADVPGTQPDAFRIGMNVPVPNRGPDHDQRSNGDVAERRFRGR